MRLSSAVYAAARACHNLDECVVLFSGLDHLENFACIGKAVGYCYLDFEVAYLVAGFLDAFYATYIFEDEQVFAELLSCNPLN